MRVLSLLASVHPVHRAAVEAAVSALPGVLLHGEPAPVGLAPAGPRPSDDPRVEFTPDNAFGGRRRDARPPSFVPGILTLVLGVLMLLGGPAGGLFGPVIASMMDPTAGMQGGTASNGEPIELPARTLINLTADPSPDQYPTTEAESMNWRPPPTPACTVTGPEGETIELTVETAPDGWETATFPTGEAGEYTAQCPLDERYAGTISMWPMGMPGDLDGDGEVDEAPGFAFTPLTIGLIVGAVGLVLVIVGIVLLVRASGRRHDLGL